MIMALLSLMDILGALFIAFGWKWELLAWIILIKGLLSLLGSFLSLHFFDWMGYIDIIAAAILFSVFDWQWFFIMPALKGVYSYLTGR